MTEPQISRHSYLCKEYGNFPNYLKEIFIEHPPNKELVKLYSEIAFNITSKNIILSEDEKKQLRPFASVLLKLSNKRISVDQKLKSLKRRRLYKKLVPLLLNTCCDLLK